ncbi:hypothetical protein BFP70_07885 [Thioclava sp. SK-1]|uniref:DUF1127 domain-containing protein n=1 Tax=Thioclava sp. SK-1 TaxID=1889770 RepID=UPI0008258DAE|nr:DUF1127 domain-containing protein [Thioclava sp. SK-1]OCX66030.1 hypothetical protein BFP70_07885 [Thioclava sp. SK-1]
MAFAQDIQGTRAGSGFMAGLKDAIARRKVYNLTLRELKSLSNRELDDLGIARSMITRVAAEAAYAK